MATERWKGAIVDLIRDGVDRRDLRERGERAVWSALVRTAASAMQHGVDRAEWIALVSEPGSHLGTQARLKRGTKPRTAAEYGKTLDRAWTSARLWLTERPAAFGPVEIVAKIRAVKERVEHPGADLTDTERTILLYACAFAETRLTDRPALSRRGVMAATGLSERVARDGLDHLADVGLLRLEVRGKSGATSNRANCYRLPDPERIRIPVPASGSMGPFAQVYGTSGSDCVGTLEQVYGTSSDPDASTVTLTVTASSPESLARAVQLLASNTDVEVDAVRPVPSGTPHTPGNVVPIDKGRRHAS